MQPVEQLLGQPRDSIAGQGQRRQGVQPVEDVLGHCGESVVRHDQSGQSAQPVEVAAAEHVQGHGPLARGRQKQRADASQVRRGQRRTVGHAGHRCHKGVAYPRAATTDRRRRHRDGEHEPGGGTVAVGGRPSIEARRGDARRRAEERARGQVDGQPRRQRPDEGIAQRARAGGGDRQDHGHARGVHDVEQGRHCLTETRSPIVVSHRDGDGVGGGDRAVAADRMPDGGGVVLAVDVLVGSHGNTLDAVPVRGEEGQGCGDVDVTVCSDQCERDGDRAGGGGTQTHRVDPLSVFGDDECSRGHDDPGTGRGNRQ